MNIPPKVPERLSAGTLHLWSVVIPEQEDVAAGIKLLSPDEQARAQRYIRPSVQHQFITVRALLRLLLGQYLQQDPKGLRFQYSASGKPSLYWGEAIAPLQFNLSHSKDRVLYAVSQTLDIGVDLEWINPQTHYWAIARRICAPSEWNIFSSLAAAQQQMAFFKIWTRKEALIKLWGDRIVDGLPTYEVPASPAPFRDWITPQNQRVWLQDLDLGDDYAAAIATSEPPQSIYQQQWCWNDAHDP